MLIKIYSNLFDIISTFTFGRISVIFSIGTKRRVKLPDHALLRRIGGITVSAVVLLAAWTALKPPGLNVHKTDDGLKFNVCDFGPLEYAALGCKLFNCALLLQRFMTVRMKSDVVNIQPF